MTGTLLENIPLRLVRNMLCRTLALTIWLSGRVHRAKRKAFETDVVTAVYFHKPNRKLFRNCVRWLKRNGYSFVSTEQLIEIVHGRLKAPRGAVWLSFDDGCKELLTGVLPVAREENVPVVLFIPSGIIQGDGLFPWMHPVSDQVLASLVQFGVRDAILVSELRTAANYPEVTIGSHTVTHAVTTNIPDDALRYEIKESKRQLESWIGAPVTSFAYPVGQFDGRESTVLAECGYELAATTEASFVTRSATAYRIPRFHVGDNIPFLEAVCNMVGVWHPTFDPFANLVLRVHGILNRWWRTSSIQSAG